MTMEHKEILSQILMTHKSFLKKTIQTAVTKLWYNSLKTVTINSVQEIFDVLVKGKRQSVLKSVMVGV